MQPTLPTRRAALALLALGGGAAALGTLWWNRPGARLLDGVEVLRPEGRRYREALLASSYGARLSPEFGRLYLERRWGPTPDAETLAAEVMARLESVRAWRDLPGPLDATDLDERLAEALRADFLAELGLCEMDGWYLSQTECRLAALRYLATL